MKSKYLIAALIGVLGVAAVVFVRYGPPDARTAAALTDVGATNIQTEWVPSSPIAPHTYTELYRFGVLSDAGDGYLFRCATKHDCDTLVAGLEARRPPEGQYVYQSTGGRTVLRLGSYLEARTAVRFADAIRDLP